MKLYRIILFNYSNTLFKEKNMKNIFSMLETILEDHDLPKTITRPSEEVDAEVIAAYASPDQPGIGWLKQDNNPADPKPVPKAQKAKAEEPIIKADIDIIDSSINNVDMKVEKIKPDFSYFIKEDEKSEKNDCTITYDNSTIINTPGMEYLKTIEAAAKRSNFNVVFKRQMFEDANIPSGIIEVLTYNSNNELMIDRSFSIDTGVIIDRRLKLIPALYGETPYEVFPIYELKTKAPNGKGKAVDEQLLNTIFQKGIPAITKRSMYDQDTLTLNSYVDLIGLSVNGIKAEDKNAITGRIKNAIAAGVFNEIAAANPGIAFRMKFKSVNVNDLSFTLTNVGATASFGHPTNCITPYEVEFLPNGTCNLKKVG